MNDKKRTFISITSLIVIIFLAFVAYSYLIKIYKPQNGLSQPSTTQATQSGTDKTDTTTKEQSNEAHADEKEKVEAPDFTVFDTDGKAVSLSDFKGKPVVINFWATWCGYCKKEMPDFEKVYKEYGDKVQFMMVNLTDGQSETEDQAREFIKKEGFTFPVYFDINNETSSLYGISGLPMTIVVGSDGNVTGYAKGMLDEETLSSAIKNLE